MDLQRQVEAADQVVTKAKAALASAEAEEVAATERLSQERAAAAGAVARKAEADPFQEKQYLAAMREAELGAARVAACERLASEAGAKVETAKVALRAAEVAAARRKLEAVEAALAAQDAALEALVRKASVPVLEAIRQHKALIREANEVRSKAREDAWELPSITTRWSSACDKLERDVALPLSGVLAAAAEALDDADFKAWKATQPPPPPSADELNRRATDAARFREVMQLIREREEREEEERYYRERNRNRSEAISMEQLEHFRQQAIDAKAARDGLAPTNPADFTPAVG